MSNSFKRPLTPQIDDPKNIDRPIQKIQSAIATLEWIEKSFGRARQSYRNENGKLIVYPEVWQGEGKDLLNVMPNDNLKSQSFITVNEPREVINFFKDKYNRIRATINIVVWFNLKEIDKTIDYPFNELLLSDLQRILTTMIFDPGDSIEINKIFDTADQVFTGFTIDKAKNQELVYPQGGFRIECTLLYNENCS